MINLAITIGNNPQNINKFLSSILFANGPIDPKQEAPTTPDTYTHAWGMKQAMMQIGGGNEEEAIAEEETTETNAV